MTPKELNRDIKRLNAYLKSISEISDKTGDSTTYFKQVDEVAKPEFIRLAGADRDCSYMNLQSLKIMLRLNLKHRFIPLHTFGIGIEI